ncbi:hypothetical protein BASA50_009095 [Batrachochytrium salamandrivorans]|uniref:BRO1 domain-containing protein n=1 Tax=Batrachochytrium salamandrivorans TaxID=1357716 RepID=A0ABQ8F2T7_9FUNG|nr:hypothetical protein BASA50_009095 [Batrachochytrium salamandrivorans]KAH9277367.1 hypothetical protein BASA83_000235 [Batrachochytrium salamandrivorans]KAJ1343185.1 hypothetical protein BSLG_002211 [Batrachochytrium salamandrivorans]
MFSMQLGRASPLLPGRFLAVPFKQTERVSFAQPLRAYIASAFAEDPDQYINDLQALDTFRAAIASPDQHDESANQHLKYYAHLHFLAGKFVMDDEHIRIAFTWASALGKDHEFTSSYNIGFEKASVLFNLAALYSQLAGNVNLTSDDTFKRAASYFQQAAGVFTMIVESLSIWNISGSSAVQLNSLSQLMLAQGQEVFFEKALAGKMKDATLAKLAQQASVFYAAAFEGASKTQVFDKAWNSYMQVKLLHWKSVSHYHRALEALGSGKYGEQIAWINAALAWSKSANDGGLMKNITLAKVSADVKAMQSILEKALQQANKDNDLIYMENIPRTESLVAIVPARMVNPTPFPDTGALMKIIEKPLFQHLVSFEIHQAASEYASKKDAISKEINDRLTEATSIAFRQVTCACTLASINLPGSIEALEQPIGLPESVLRRSEEVRSLGGAQGLESTLYTVQSLSKRSWEILRDAMEMLDTEAAGDQSLQLQFGSKWSRATSASLGQNLRDAEQRFRKKLQDADNSNRVVWSKMETHAHLIANLSLARSELEASVPASTAATTLALRDPNLIQLKGFLDQINASVKLRVELVAKVKETVKNDDIVPRLLESAANGAVFDKSAVFAEQLKLYTTFDEQASNIISQQETLLGSIVSCNKIFTESRQTSELIRNRENALQSLGDGYKAFKEITSNLDEGVKFYNDMEHSLSKLRASCRDFTLARDIEKKDMLSQIQQNVINMRFSDAPGSSPSGPPTSSPYAASAPTFGQLGPASYANQPMPAPPLPGTWNPAQSLQYGQIQQGYSNPQPPNYASMPNNAAQPTGVWNSGQPLQYGQSAQQQPPHPPQPSPASASAYPGGAQYGVYQPQSHPPQYRPQ